MAVLYVRPQSDLRFSTDQMGVRTISHSYVVKSSVPNESKLTILASGLLPVFGYSPHPQDLYAICCRMDLQQMKEGSQFWTAQAEWKTFAGPRDPKDQQNNPDQRRPIWRYNFQPISKYFPADLDGKLFRDTATMPFDPPPERPIWVDEVTVTRFETTLSRKSDRKYLNAANSDTWQDAKPGEAMIHNIAAEEIYEFGKYWFQRTFTVLVNPRITIPGILDAGGKPFIGAWDYECILNQGPCFLGVPAIPLLPVPMPLSNAGFIDGRPRCLDINGQPLASNAATSSNVYLRFRLHNSTAFAPLNLIPPY